VARVGHGGQGDLLFFADAVLGKQLAQLITPYSALRSLDPADLGAVAVQDPGCVIE
jgi:hypothetical protein